jgi:hypothetical protein
VSDDQHVPSWLMTATSYTWRGLVLVIGAIMALFVLTRLYLVTLPVIIALILATLFVPPARWLQRKGFRPAAAALTVVLGGIAVGLGLDPLLLLVPAAIAATCSFMLPVGTPPNAIIFGTGRVTMGQMIRAGFWLNLIGVVLITAAVMALGAWAMGISF